MKLLIPIIAVLALVGCERRDQAASEAIIGVDAMAQMIGTEEGYAVAQGATDYILATRGAVSAADLPPPHWTTADVIEQPQAYADEGKKSREENSGGFWAMVGAGALTAAALLAGAVRSLGIGGHIAQLAAGVFLNRTQKETKRAREMLADIAPVVIQAVEVANADNVKDLVKIELDGEAILNDIIEQIAGQKKTPPI